MLSRWFLPFKILYVCYPGAGKTLGNSLTRVSGLNCEVVYHLQRSRERSGSASVCPFSSWIPALGCLIGLGLTQTCSLSPHFTHFLPDDLSISAASEHIQCALEKRPCSQYRCQDAHWFAQPYVCLSPIAPSICSGSDACPYVSACDSACV